MSLLEKIVFIQMTNILLFIVIEWAIVAHIVLVSTYYTSSKPIFSNKPPNKNFVRRQNIKFLDGNQEPSSTVSEITFLFAHMIDLREKFSSCVNFHVIPFGIYSLGNGIEHNLSYNISVNHMIKKLYVLGCILLNIFTHYFLSVYIILLIEIEEFCRRSILNPIIQPKSNLHAIANIPMNSFTCNSL